METNEEISLSRGVSSSLLLIACLGSIGQSETADARHINANTLATIGLLTEHEVDPERMMGVLMNHRESMGSLKGATIGGPT